MSVVLDSNIYISALTSDNRPLILIQKLLKILGRKSSTPTPSSLKRFGCYATSSGRTVICGNPKRCCGQW